mmetsp:Transcript_23329/g.31212  ORF Transcript_23329/g.31212 Transcript_23329/m.31212 type:complete len:92 (+) Transcript_23329:420-695(+)
MGYGAESGTMNSEYFEIVTRDDSVFGKKILRLRSVCWMNPRAYVEHIPANWKQVDVALYHVYQRNWNLREANFNVFVASQMKLMESGEKEY